MASNQRLWRYVGPQWPSVRSKPRPLLIPSLWLGQVGGSPTVNVEVRPAFAAAVRDNKEIATKVAGRTQSARRASLFCTLAALRSTANAMGVVDSLVDHFGGSPADRALLCEASTTVTAGDALTADTAAL
jgi:hypothetical protein